MITHRLGWADEGMALVDRCGTTRIKEELILTAPSGPMGGSEGDDFYAKPCPVCGARLILRWGVCVDVLRSDH